MRFDELQLEDAILDGLDAMNFVEATPVQEKTIPVILEGKDVIACAQKSKRKTAGGFYEATIIGTEADFYRGSFLVPACGSCEKSDYPLSVGGHE